MDGLEVQERGHRPNDDGLFVPEDVKGFTETGPVTPDQEHASKQPRHVPWGLSPLVFAIVVALLTMIVVGAAVGGGLGASLAAARRSTSSYGCSYAPDPTPSTTATTAPRMSLKNYTVADPKQVAEVPLDCPHRNGERYATVRGQVYTITCSERYVDYDLASITAYTLDACIEACSSMNHFEYARNRNTTLCPAVLFFANMNATDSMKQYANCWLKNGTSQVFENIGGYATANLVSGPGG